jgi:outer membrane protein assembly factor BamD (BamD/ComL family)
MSVVGILSSLFTNTTLQNVSSKKQQFQAEFKQLGQDLQSGNLAAAQTDFAALQKDAPQLTASSQQSGPIALGLEQLAQDLQSGNTTAARQDFANIQQSYQNQAQPHHHHHAGGVQEQSSVSQLFAELGQDLQAGNKAAALQAYAGLQNAFQAFGTNASTTSTNGVTATA